MPGVDRIQNRKSGIDERRFAMAIDKGVLPNLEALPPDLQEPIRQHEGRTFEALERWRRSGNENDYAEVTCGVLCIRTLAETHIDIGESAASEEARKEITTFAEDWRLKICDEHSLLTRST
jgi:hypothetical protein